MAKNFNALIGFYKSLGFNLAQASELASQFLY